MKYCHSLSIAHTLSVAIVFSLITNLIVVPQSGAQEISEARQPYNLRFDDFEWFEPGNLQPLLGASPIVEQADTEAAIAIVKDRLVKQPLDYANMTLLGQLLLKHAKQKDDLPAYAESESVLRDSLRINPDYQPAKLALAATMMARHAFSGALAIATQLNDDLPDRPSTLAVLFDCQLELGEYQQAKLSLARLQSLENSAPVLARAARMSEISGNRTEAIALIDQAIEYLSQTSISSNSEQAWYHWRKATLLLDSGCTTAAREVLETALESDNADEAILVCMANAQFASGNIDVAVKTLEKASVGEAPPVIALLGDAYALLGDSNKAHQLWNRTEELMREEAKVAKVAHAREVAMFYADHNRNLPEALLLSEIDLQQRSDPYAWDAHAWVLFKNGMLPDAKSAINKALSHVHGDNRILFHAAAIEFSSGNLQAAQSLVNQIKQANPNLSITYSAEFKTLQNQLELKL